MTPAERLAAEEIVAHHLDVMRLAAHAQAVALDLLDQLGRELEAELRRSDLTQFSRARLQSLIASTADTVDAYYSRLSGQQSEYLRAASETQVRAAAESLRQGGLAIVIDASLPTQDLVQRLATASLVEGAKSADWWKRQAADTKFRFVAAVRQGVARGETLEQMVSRVAGTRTTPGVMTTSKASARSLVHASVQQVANEARLATFRKNADVVKGVRQLSTLDGHTTPICVAYGGQTWDLAGKPIGRTVLPFNGGPPRHWGCRSVLVPITKTLREMGLDVNEALPGGRASDIGPVPANVTMRQWMDSRSAAQLDEQLGRGRASLYRSGKITLQQLVDLRGNPLSVKQLEARYG